MPTNSNEQQLLSYLIHKLENLEDNQRKDHQEIMDKFCEVSEKWESKHSELKQKVDSHEHTFNLFKWAIGSSGVIAVLSNLKDFFHWPKA